MSTRRQWRDFVRLNPEYTWLAKQQGLGQFRPPALVREVGTDVGLALFDENHGTPAERAAEIAERATLAQEGGQHREALLAWRFAALNPGSDLAPSRTDPDQHALAHDRERLHALGSRVYSAEARENTGDPEPTTALVRLRGRYATARALANQPTERHATARAGAER
jgi:hypothetical protein